ncbi:hypothetical protein ABL78_3305 [Leptomonas seymouri]|uniref:Uncharacterized protein n=1 Tax=Leptomonas seymouri TaxID=5684 RepID=A0A0N0P6F9_LEPSE|nr:hypothetical protein ABL78_3305 [Leptomonas seymouri]|eukprot:KPI87596.1 hypothetical protein ABL78_3305 [Leptomonas seymouri]
MQQFFKQHVQSSILQQQQQSPSRQLDPQSNAVEGSPARLLEALRRIPKTDLHCHLNGSITSSLLAHMERLLLQAHRRAHTGGASNSAKDLTSPTAEEAEEGHTLFFNTQEKRMRNVLASPTSEDAASALPGASPSHSSPKDRMNYCFTVFDAIYKIMTSLAFTRLAVQDMLLCSAAESILVMEIRTSLRNGLVHTFRHSDAATEAAESADTTVSKQMYVDTIIETVEHVLSGGLVDLESGELLSMEASAAILAHPQCAVDEELGERTDQDVTAAGAVARWWRAYDRVYSSLFTAESLPEPSPSPPAPPVVRGSTDPHSHRLLLTNVAHPNLVYRTHIRLLLSINRAAAEDAAWEVARLTTRTQQRQIRQFHTWCCSAEATNPERVLRKLRQTCWVTGVDLSGNCYKGHYATFNAALAAARSGSAPAAKRDAASLAAAADVIATTASVTLHGGEKQDIEELSAMVAFSPERWGHLVFTDDDNLSRILAAQQGIELCLTSNLLTSGHADVAEHHLGHLLELWDSMPQSRRAAADEDGSLSPFAKCFEATEAARLAARAVLAERHSGEGPAFGFANTFQSGKRATESDTDSSCYVLPNISFHTDDRGVFGTTLSNELLLASQHPAVQRLCHRLTGVEAISVTAFAEFFWLFERLSLTQVFSLPLPVQLLGALRLMDGQEASSEAHWSAASLASALNSVLAQKDWRDWATFVQVCAAVSRKETATGLASQLSCWEYMWLGREFDRYYP